MTPFLEMAILVDTVARKQGDQALRWRGDPTRSHLDLQVIDVGPFRAKEGILSTSLKEAPSITPAPHDGSVRCKAGNQCLSVA